MLYAYSETKEKIKATPRAVGFCPDCGEQLVPKCGEKVIWHWAHKTGTSHEVKEETEWHLLWKELVPKEWCEIKVGEHRADIRLPNEFVVEFQHSNISEDDVHDRQWEYKTMIWVLDGREGEKYSKARDSTYHRFSQYYVDCGEKMYFYDHFSGFYKDIDKEIFVGELKAGRIYDYKPEIAEKQRLAKIEERIESVKNELSSLQNRHNQVVVELSKMENVAKQQVAITVKEEGKRLRAQMNIDIDGERHRIYATEYILAKTDAKRKLKEEWSDIQRNVFEEIKSSLHKQAQDFLNNIQKEIIKQQIPLLRYTPNGQEYYPKCLEHIGAIFKGNVLCATISWSDYDKQLHQLLPPD